MKYFYTNDNLVDILEKDNGMINWERNGFSVKQISRAVQKGSQGETDKGFVSVLPIADEKQLNKVLGGLIATGEDEDGYFYRIIEEAEKDAVIAEIKKKKEEHMLSADTTE